MKIQTIAVQPESPIEELVKELIDSAADRIVLAGGPEANVLNREINLRLLKFYAEEEDKEIWIQSANPQLINLAARLEIPLAGEEPADPRGAAAAVEAAQKTVIETAAAPEDDETAPFPKAIRRQGGILIAIAAACFALVIAVWWLFQPTVVVTVYPKEKDLNIRTQAMIGASFTDKQLPQGKIPGKIVAKEASLTIRTATTGQKIIGITAATGKVTFINPSTRAIVVPRGTVLTGRDHCRFTTGSDILVPKKTARTILGIPVGEEYGRAEAGIAALEKGTAGNQPAKAIQTVTGSLARSLKAINLVPTTGGANQEVRVVAPADLKRAAAEAQQQMALAAPEELTALIGRDYLFWPELARTTMIRNLFQPQIGMESGVLTHRLDYRAAALVVARVDLQKYLAHLLAVQTPAGFRPMGRAAELLTTRVVPDGERNATLEIEAKARIRGFLDPHKLRGMIVGKEMTAAQAALTAQDEIAGFRFNLRRPMTRLPRFAFQIKVLTSENSLR